MEKYQFLTRYLTLWLLTFLAGAGLVVWSLSATGIRGYAIREEAWMVGLALGVVLMGVGGYLGWYRMNKTGSLFDPAEGKKND